MKSSKKTTPRVVSSKPFPAAVPKKSDAKEAARVGGIGNTSVGVTKSYKKGAG